MEVINSDKFLVERGGY